MGALIKTNGHRGEAAKILDVSHRVILYKIREYQMENAVRFLVALSNNPTKREA
jgi:DNA-binding NtrC family response regulator